MTETNMHTQRMQSAITTFVVYAIMSGSVYVPPRTAAWDDFGASSPFAELVVIGFLRVLLGEMRLVTPFAYIVLRRVPTASDRAIPASYEARQPIE